MAYVSHFRELRVWQRGMDLVEAIYRVSAAFPKAELYGLTGQIRRAAVSIPPNIAEGHMRASTKEYLNHLSIAQASLAESETHLEIAVRLQLVASAASRPILDQASVSGKRLWALRIAVSKRR
jgi:four helix bundle protein